MFFKRQNGSNQPITLGEIPEGSRLLTEEELQCVSGGVTRMKEVHNLSGSASANSVCFSYTLIPSYTFTIPLTNLEVTTKPYKPGVCVKPKPPAKTSEPTAPTAPTVSSSAAEQFMSHHNGPQFAFFE